ncbi:diguanylate cyclase (GGDEF)-like protein/PAS domain S-box-containing protein [Paenibacillus shirakamiensis]|uniref:Diguanylate cyclase (GGDEF)-like protein/PAS domain S-box-containing protein n=1 Tax=Paenibacillus shirakamiensis TaxID=1265935 RepID=A0ABS4JI09_9BACL|nr:diguanylate cyclase [Paenibacillus shirakamiensis]MBP2001350.1 diguanylate cyclase (GGDEF)-like protein/PAS domain S-box-containing protein [Paenibacillus shirakamiensis]
MDQSEERNTTAADNTLNRSLLTKGEYVSGEVDLTNCDREPIHIPGTIQPHGVLLAVESDGDYCIVQCSANAEDFLRISIQELMGRPLASLLGEDQLERIMKTEFRVDPLKLHYMHIDVEVGGVATQFYGILHESEGLIVLELENAEPESGFAEFHDFEWIQSFFTKMKQAHNRYEASQMAAEQVKGILDYDRVMVYEFDEAWNGKVIGESKEEGLEPYLGHHYPASDIPKQARELYLRNWLRTIVDVNYIPVKVVPTLNPMTDQPLNLSLSILRSVSPLHIEYLKNMGVNATMTISLIHNNKLWGLITCHHYSPKYIPHRLRNLCNFLGSFFSSELYQRQQLDDYQSELHLKNLSNRLSRIFIGNTAASVIIEQVDKQQDLVLEVMNASGAALLYHGQLLLMGDTPSAVQVKDLSVWMAEQSDNLIYHTSKLSLEYAPAEAYKSKASGAVYLALSQDHENYMIWFRPEVLQIVNWAGDPAKAVIQEEDGIRLSPRKSFEKWRQVVEASSLPWKAKELRVLPDLKTIVLQQTENQLRHAEEQAQINLRVSRENEQRYLQLMELSPIAFFVITKGKVVYYNQEAAKLFSVQAEDRSSLQNIEYLDLVAEQSREHMRQLMMETERSDMQLISIEEKFKSMDDRILHLEITMAHVVSGGKKSLFAIFREREENPQLKKSYNEVTEQLQSFLQLDALTELPNQSHFEKTLDRTWHELLVDGKGSPEPSIALFMIDIDNFKLYNAVHGLQTGDLCMQWVADVIDAYSKMHEGFTARYEGGRFVLFVTGQHVAHVKELGEQIRQGVLDVQIPLNLPDIGEFVTVSLGIATLAPSTETQPTLLIKTAERALRRAKNAGKNRVIILE